MKVLYDEYPELWSKLKEWENKTDRTFRYGETLEEREKKFK